MLRTIIILLSLSIILMIFRDYNHQSLNRASYDRFHKSKDAAIERQKSVPLRQRDTGTRQRQR
ncbi:MAG: hypothetical protein ABJN57_13475 [Hyphomicrobiales bacterium]|jgi:hypothetical protein